MAYTSLQQFNVVVRGGLEVSVREVVPEDGDLIALGFERLSRRSRFFRFMGAKKGLSDEEVASFSAVNTVDHVAVGALRIHEPDVQPAGIARYIRTNLGSHTAEIAVTVVDAFQTRGIGTLLLGVLAKTAHANGVTEFEALVAEENTAMRRILLELGGIEATSDAPEVNISLQIYDDPKNYPDNAIGARFRRAYANARLASH